MRTTTWHPTRTALLGVVLALAALFAACSRSRPSQFPHRAHLVELACGKPGQPECLKCNGCHSPRQHGRAHQLPDESFCARCHQKDAHDVVQVLQAPPRRPFGPITFDHDKHLDMPQIVGQCVPCHSGVIESDEQRIPPMSKCLQCHEHEQQFQAGVCTPCHAATDLRKILPQSFMRHEGNFMRHHASLVADQGQLCQACHTQADCSNCHDLSQIMSVEQRQPEKIDRQFVHRADFVVRHAMEAQSQPAKCLRCHEPSTCDACHLERGVSANRLGGRSPHPPEWVSTDPGGLNLHGRHARRDILLCASCHDQGPATNCIRCHRVGGPGGNPHPGGWRSSRSTGDSMCRYCHE
jgi:hypothetical protein